MVFYLGAALAVAGLARIWFLWRALHGDLGTSFVFNQPAIQLILQRLREPSTPATTTIAPVRLHARASSQFTLPGDAA